MVELLLKHKRGREVRLHATVKTIAQRLLNVMKNHIGWENSVSRHVLFKKVYMVGDHEIPHLQAYVLWDLLKRAGHYCRQRTKCFITNKRNKGEYYYFVVKDNSDAQCYSDIVNKSIKNLRAMEKKCFKAVTQKWYKEEWTL